MNIQEHVSLKEYTTFRIGGPARYFCIAQSSHDVIEALRWAQEKKISTFILGGGSNLLFSDDGFNGLVIKLQINFFEVNATMVTVGASVVLAELIEKTLAAGLTGLEFAAGIPGEVGGAIRGNAGTYGVSMGDCIDEVLVVNRSTLQEERIKAAECGFAYRHSSFKENGDIIISAKMRLSQGDVSASKKIIDERIQVRHENHPLEPSAGCVFKNIEFSKIDENDLAKRGVDLEQFRKYQKIPTGFLVEQLGLKGKMIGGAAISARHGNYIINNGTATFEDVIILISLIKQQVRDAFGIQLEEEIHVIS